MLGVGIADIGPALSESQNAYKLQQCHCEFIAADRQRTVRTADMPTQTANSVGVGCNDWTEARLRYS